MKRTTLVDSLRERIDAIGTTSGPFLRRSGNGPGYTIAGHLSQIWLDQTGTRHGWSHWTGAPYGWRAVFLPGTRDVSFRHLPPEAVDWAGFTEAEADTLCWASCRNLPRVLDILERGEARPYRTPDSITTPDLIPDMTRVLCTYHWDTFDPETGKYIQHTRTQTATTLAYHIVARRTTYTVRHDGGYIDVIPAKYVTTQQTPA